MIRRINSAFFLSFAVAFVFATPGLCIENDATPGELQRAGITKLWASHVQLDSSRGYLVDLHLHVNDTSAHTNFEIYVGGVLRETISTTARDKAGFLLGNKRALARANLRKEIIEHDVAAAIAPNDMDRETFDALVYGNSAEQITARQEYLKSANKSVEVKKSTLPKTTLYAISSQSVIHAIDAETGKTRWVTKIGRRDYPTLQISSSDQLVAAINGSNVYCLSAKDGSILWSRSCQSSPGAGPSLSHNFVFVPLITGVVQAFPIQTKGVNPRLFVSSGRAMVQPLVTGRTVSWPTDRGHYNVAYYSKKITGKEVGAIKYRLNLNSQFSAVAGRASRVLFVPCENGYIYAMDEILGAIYWEYSSGEPISQSPIAIGDWLYFVTDDNNLYRLGIRDGNASEEWPARVPGISKIVSISSDRIYAMDPTDNLVVLRLDTGSRVAQLPVGSSDIRLFNEKTDRLYVGNSKGRIQCWRETKQLHPILHGASAAEDAEAKEKPAAKTPADEKGKSKNPFETEEELAKDPFTAADPEPINPFATEGEDANPFATDDDTDADEKSPFDDPIDNAKKDPFGDGK